MRGIVTLLAALVVAGLLLTWAEPLAPSVTLEPLPTVVGAGTPIDVVARDRGTGLASVEVRLLPEGAESGLTLARQEFPKTSWRGSGVHETSLSARLGESAAVAEGPARLQLWATDHSWLGALRGGLRAEYPVTVDRTPPTASIVSSQHAARQGGSECVVFRVDPDTTDAGVAVGDEVFPAVAGFFADPALRVALFAIPWDRPDAVAQVVARDAAGNTRRLPVDVRVRPRSWAQKTLAITDDFLQRKVPELLAANRLDTSGTLVDGYLRINRALRGRTEERVGEVTRTSTPAMLWEGAFMRLPDGAPLSGFADQRTYVHDGAVIDRQTHLGFDLASLKRAAVPAANTGRVAFTGTLGIYGDTVILDHGLGLFSLYGHLSEIAVTTGTTVRKGDLLGKTGDTGLAGGDHLHFSTMIHGVHVDPVEWWDAHWIKDHVLARLAPFPRAAVTSPAAPQGESSPPAGAAPGAALAPPQSAAERRS